MIVPFSKIIEIKDKVKERIFLADSSFIIAKNIKDDLFHNACGEFHAALFKNNYFVTNITIKQELLHYIRKALIKKWRREHNIKLPKKLTRNSQFVQALLEMKKLNHFSSFIKGEIKKGIDEYEKYFPYISAEKFRQALKSADLPPMMEKYLLDSSDAMIANFAISSRMFDGIITCDIDYIFLAEHTHIFIPDKVYTQLAKYFQP